MVAHVRQWLKANLWISALLVLAVLVIDLMVNMQPKGAYSRALTLSQGAAWLGLLLSCGTQFCAGWAGLFTRGNRLLGAFAILAVPVILTAWLVWLFFTAPGFFLGVR